MCVVQKEVTDVCDKEGYYLCVVQKAVLGVCVWYRRL